MTLAAKQKEAAKEKLRKDIDKLKLDTFDYWRELLRMPEEQRKHSGYSKGADDMIAKLTKAYDKKLAALMKPFDQGDYD